MGDRINHVRPVIVFTVSERAIIVLICMGFIKALETSDNSQSISILYLSIKSNLGVHGRLLDNGLICWYLGIFLLHSALSKDRSRSTSR